MKKLALILCDGLRSYAADNLSSYSGKVSCVIDWAGAFPQTKGRIGKISAALKRNLRSVPKFFSFKISSFDSVLLISEDRRIVLDMIYRVMLSGKNAEIFFVKPFCVKERMNFIKAGDFDTKLVKRVPAFNKFNADDILSPIVSPAAIAKNIVRTKDGIEACELEKIFVKISSLIGCTYTADYEIIADCINGERQFALDTCINSASGVNPDVVYDDYVCPLTRLYSSFSFYHFLYEVLDKILIAEELAYNGKYMLFRTSYAEALIKLSGIEGERVIWIDENDSGKLFLLKKAFNVEGFMLGSLKGLSRLNKFADDVVLKFGASGDYPRRIFITQDKAAPEPGFTAISPENYSPDEIMKFFFHADAVMSGDNQVIANALFMRRGSELIEKFPHNWGTLFLADVIASRGLKYSFA